MAKCPHCGSLRFRYELRSAGSSSRSRYYSTGFGSNLIVPAGLKRRKSQSRHKSVGICPDCGHVEEKHGVGCTPVVLCFLAFAVFCALISGGANPTPKANNNTIWRDSYTPLELFDFYIDGAEIVLKEYRGDEQNVNIAPAYNFEGVEYPVVALEGTFALDRVRSVIVPESVTAIAHNAFNSCGVEYLYLPKSLTDFTGWTYFHGVQKIYYGGSESDWAALYTGERSRLDVVQIVYNADPQALPEG